MTMPGHPRATGSDVEAVVGEPVTDAVLDARRQVSFDGYEFRRTMGRFATGISVVTMLRDDAPYGITVNSFMSLSLTPPLIAVSIDTSAGAHATLLAAERFGVSVLSAEQSDLSDRFAGRPVAHAADPFTSLAGFPVIAGAIGTLIGRIVRTVDVGDHTLFIAEVETIERRDGQPLIFFGGQYRVLDH